MHWREIPGNEHAFDRLKARIDTQTAISFVGAGASAGLYPLWGELLEMLVSQAVDRGLAGEEERTYWLRERERRPQQVVRGLKQKLGDGVYAQALREIFRPKVGADGHAYTPIHSALMQLPFRGHVTTNYDPGLLEARLELRPDSRATGWATWKDADTVHLWYTGGIFDEQPCPVLFAHGIYERSDTVVLGAGEYRNAYAPGAYRRLFEALWGQQHLVFAGFGFSDPWLDYLADEVITQTGARVAEPRHVALIGLPEDEPYTQEVRHLFRDQYHADVVFYPVTDGGRNHGALLDVLQSLGLRPQEPLAVRAPTAGAPPGRWVHETTEDDRYVERRGVIRLLDRWVDDPEVRVIAVTGLGGLGKTSLVGHWLKQRGGDRRRPTQGLFYWSFYAERDVGEFLEALLRYVTDELALPMAHEGTVVQVVAHLLRRHPLLLVLDGLEVLQERPDSVAYGALLSHKLREVLNISCRDHSGLVVLTSRFPFRDLIPYLGTSFRALDLDVLLPSEGAALLERSGVDGTISERESVSRRFHGHPLALRIFGAALAEQVHNDPARLLDQVFSEATLSESGLLERKLRHLLTFYERVLPPERTTTLGLVSLFRAPVPTATLVTLARRLPCLEETLGTLTGEELQQILTRLEHDRHVLRDHRDGASEWSCHPILRDHFRQVLLGGHQGVADSVANLLTDQPSGERPTDIRALEPALTAIELLLDAGDFERADELFRTRLNNGRNLRWLPAFSDLARCALGFVSDEARRARCESRLSARRTSFYLHKVALYSELAFSEPYYEAAEAIDERVGDTRSLAIGLYNQALFYRLLGRLTDAEKKANKALRLVRHTNHWREVRTAYARLGDTIAHQGRAGEAIAAFESANALETGKSPNGNELYSFRGTMWTDLLLRLGHTSRARELLEANMKICQDHGWGNDVARCRSQLGRLNALDGRIDEASEHFSAAEDAMRQGQMIRHLPRLLLARGELERRQEHWETAWRYVDEALQLAMPRGMRLDHADGLVLRARLRIGRAEAERTDTATVPEDAVLRAQDDLHAALMLARDCGYAWAERGALALLARSSSALGDRERAHAFRRDAEVLDARLQLGDTDAPQA